MEGKSEFLNALVAIVGLIVTVAIIAVLVSRNANTTGVIQASASGLGNDLAVAEAPVTGAATNINLGYPAVASAGLAPLGSPFAMG